MAAKEKKNLFEKRIHEIDLVRGLLILLVVMDHVFYCFYHYGTHWFGPEHWMSSFFGWYWTSIPRMIIQPLAVGLFCFISGVSTSFSRNNWKRVIMMLAFWFIILVGSNVLQIIVTKNNMDMNIRVDFNVIGCLAFCSLIYCFIQKRSWKGILAAFLIAWLLSSYFVPMLRTGLYNVVGGRISWRIGASYAIPNVYLIPLWEYPVQADYVPLFPFLLFFLGGALLSVFFYRDKKKSYFKRREWERPICFIGRHTLVIYLAHFIVIRGIFMIISFIMEGKIY